MFSKGTNSTTSSEAPPSGSDSTPPVAHAASSAHSEEPASPARTLFRAAQDQHATKLLPVVDGTATLPRSAGGTSISHTRADAAARIVLSGRYRLEECLGEGGMGVVFRAADLRMPGVFVAIKLLKPEFRERSELLNILHESVRKVRSLPHSNIAGVYSLDSDGNSDFVVMELLQGQTLQSLLDGEYARGMPMALARTLIADICSALAYAHDHGIVHSDLKPSNIFVTPSGRAKLFDFDIARVLRGPVGYFDASQIGALTNAYATAEMLRGEPADPRDDVYALACVTYEMLSGKHPFGGASAFQARERGLRIKPLPALRRRENDALAEALKFEREERLANVEALRAAFGATTVLDFSRIKWPLVFAVGAVCILAISILWWLNSSNGTPHQTFAANLAAELAGAHALAIRTTQLGLDPNDSVLHRALDLLGAAQTSDQPERALKQAQEASAALRVSLARSPRIAHLGSNESQMLQALQLCRELHLASQRCVAKDLADEVSRSVSLRPFVIDPTTVTNADFARFVEATKRRTGAEVEGAVYAPDPANGWYDVRRGQNWKTLRDAAAARGQSAAALPVLAMDIESARAYCQWKGVRLPTEDEWEYSVRGPSARVFPWGDEAKTSGSSPPQEAAAAEAGVARDGDLHALVSNVAEWTETHIEGQRVLRGGSWLLPQAYFQRLALRRLAAPHAMLDGGFRCAMSRESWPDIQ